jgi:phosphoketolase
MVGAMRQEIIFARQQKILNRPAQWLSMAVIATSHVWENGKNEQSHQDPSFGEVLLGEMSDVTRVVYPVDANSALACLNACYGTQGQMWVITAPKLKQPAQLNKAQALKLIQDGALALTESKQVQLVAIGAYQLQVCQKVSELLASQRISSGITCLFEPGRFRAARDEYEAQHQTPATIRQQIFPDDTQLRVFVCHTRPEPILGVCRHLDLGPDQTLAFGYTNHGGTFDTKGLLRANDSDPESIVQAIQRRIH